MHFNPSPSTTQIPLAATARLPAIDKPTPHQIAAGIFSFKRNGEASATHKGVVATSTTELITVVISSEVIQAAK